MLRLVADFQRNKPLTLNLKFVQGIQSILSDTSLDKLNNNKSSGPYELDHSNMSWRALKNISLGYLASLEDAELAELALQEYKTATNMIEQFAAIAAISQTLEKLVMMLWLISITSGKITTWW